MTQKHWNENGVSGQWFMPFHVTSKGIVIGMDQHESPDWRPNFEDWILYEDTNKDNKNEDKKNKNI